jgi:hypothetical protein
MGCARRYIDGINSIKNEGAPGVRILAPQPASPSIEVTGFGLRIRPTYPRLAPTACEQRPQKALCCPDGVILAAGLRRRQSNF